MHPAMSNRAPASQVPLTTRTSSLPPARTHIRHFQGRPRRVRGRAGPTPSRWLLAFVVVLALCVPSVLMQNTTTTTTTTTPPTATSTVMPTTTATAATPPLPTVGNNTNSTTNATTTTATTTTFTTTPVSTTTTEGCVDSDPFLCGFIAEEGHCRSPEFVHLASLCCATCSNSTLAGAERTWYVCGFGGDEPSSVCLTRGQETCFPVVTSPRSCTRLPTVFGLGERYLRLEDQGSAPGDELNNFHFSIHRDAACTTSYSLDSSLSGSTNLGSCTAVSAGTTTIFHMTVFANCTEQQGNWTCFGTNLPCFHWTRRSRDLCELPGDSVTCKWDAATQSCTLPGAAQGCSGRVPPNCASDTCRYDAYFRRCVPTSQCQCTMDGLSGGVRVFHQGCSADHRESMYSGQSICYIRGGAAAAGTCGCVQQSTVYPGAAFRPCIGRDNCNVLLLESDDAPIVNGMYIATPSDVSSYGCVPTFSFLSSAYGLGDSRMLFTAEPEEGKAPENLPWRNIADTWLFFELKDAISIFQDIILSGFIASEHVPLIRETPSKDPANLTGIWDALSGTEIRKPVFVRHTCSAQLPCSRPLVNVFPSDIDTSMTVGDKIAAVQTIPDLATIVADLVGTPLFYFLSTSVVATRTPIVRASFVATQPDIANTTFVPTVSLFTCTGVSRANPKAQLETVTETMDMSTVALRSGLFSLSLHPYGAYLCRQHNTGPACLATKDVDHIFLTPARPPSTTVSNLGIQALTPVCATLNWDAMDIRDVNGEPRGYRFNVTAGRTAISCISLPQPPPLPPPSMQVSIVAVNNVGTGPAAFTSFYTQDGLVLGSPPLNVSRMGPEQIVLTWQPLPARLLNGRVRSYHIVEFSAATVEALDALSIADGSNDPRTAETPDTDFGGITVVDADTLQYEVNNLVPERAYAYAIAVQNQDNIGAYGDFVTVAASTAGSGSDGLSASDTVSIIAFVFIPTIVGLILFVTYRRLPYLRRKMPNTLPPDVMRQYEIRNASLVIVDELLAETSIYTILRGSMPNLLRKDKEEIVSVTVKQLRDPRSDDQLLAPESISDNEFSPASDMFAFGVVLWEIFSYGQKPWAGFSNSEVATNVSKRGTPLDRPQACPHSIYKVMLQCWRMASSERPIPQKLQELLSEAMESSASTTLISHTITPRQSLVPTESSSGSRFGSVDTIDAMGMALYDAPNSADVLTTDSDASLMHGQAQLFSKADLNAYAKKDSDEPRPSSLTPSTDSDSHEQGNHHDLKAFDSPSPNNSQLSPLTTRKQSLSKLTRASCV
ncbi:serine/threonine protein kinase [Salpingoeca rosetta]|uniref:Serine/threonine protein kinase n=1 Tax=Salpingoeca rosetta (strain ATCC 50818 / BSB-021) TaxID=946362 RepID=F2UT46_SALR5|nr:serine/threonine protein kinase [Salpingoeca rosetta]EGD81305.1 serine/threonine protein kinase [Salpingoeca rosetta]|eukprot:XP_004987701.1 serine/threonine protein kinase [Salpingoeca rosetta]